jgi:lysozyme family protein
MNGVLSTCLAFTLAKDVEGGYSDNADDPGGSTMAGVTQSTLDDARETIPGLPLDVKDLTAEDETKIYDGIFFTPIAGSLIPMWAAIAMFDAAVNSGPGTVAKWMQAGLGLPADGKMGPQTIGALQQCDPVKALVEFHGRRAFNFMEQHMIEHTFGLGWGRRLIRCHNYATSFIGK